MASLSSVKYEQERNMGDLHRTSKDFSKEERTRLMDQFRASGLGFKEFASEHNLNPSTLKNWKWLPERPPGVKTQRTPVERKKIVEAFLSAESLGREPTVAVKMASAI
jgi:transposase-like protein